MIDGVMLIAAYSARSKAYMQALARQGLAPETILLFGDPGRDKVSAPDNTQEGGAVFLPDLSERLIDTCLQARATVLKEECDNVNDARIRDHIQAVRPRLLIYSGYGGQIVGEELLDEGVPLLHLHAGLLPEYRGSTTIYYSWLQERSCGVTALLLNSGIDEGQIVDRRKYELPPPGVDVDSVYDNAIRADLLCQVLKQYAENGSFESASQPTSDVEIFYVIHPVVHNPLTSQWYKVGVRTKRIEDTLSVGISPGLNMMFGNYGDNRQTLKQAVDFLVKYDDFAQMRTIRPVTPYPGSPLYYDAIRDGKLEGPEDFYENKHVNSDLICVNFTELSDAEFYDCPAEANTILLENYYGNARQSALDAVENLYGNLDASFRGFRHNSGGQDNVNMMS